MKKRNPAVCHPERGNFGGGLCRRCYDKKRRPPEQRYAMTIGEIAMETGYSEDSITSMLYRALKKLGDGRADKIKELVIAREKEAKRQLPRIVEGCIC